MNIHKVIYRKEKNILKYFQQYFYTETIFSYFAQLFGAISIPDKLRVWEPNSKFQDIVPSRSRINGQKPDIVQ